MPIKGLTDRGLAFPEIGQIRKGGKKFKDANTGKDRIGLDLQYFRVEFDERDVEVIKKFIEIYGEKPTQINILLPFNEINRVWDAYLEAYTAGRMVARSDGEKFLYKVNTQSGEIEVVNGEPELAFDASKPVGTYLSNGKNIGIFCKPVGRLRVVIPELKRLAYLTVLTTSKHDIMNISAQLAAIENMTNGKISGIPLVLKRSPRMISTPSADGQRARREKWLLSIEADPKWVESQINSMQMLSFPASVTPLPELNSGIVNKLSVQSLPDDEEENDDDIPEFNDDQPIDGQFSNSDSPEKETKPETKTEAKPETQSQSNTRPYPPKALKDRIQVMVDSFAGQKCTPGQRTSVKINIVSMAGSEDNGHTLLKWLVGNAHISELSDAQILALGKWIHVTKDADDQWIPDAMSIQECHAAFKEALKAQGQ